MGGEFDSTNIIRTPEASVITNIGLDHVEVLGDTLEKIAQAKAGIIKGGDAILYRSTEGVEQVFAEACEKTNTRLHLAEFDTLVLHESSFAGQIFDCGARKNIELPLLGEHQRKNAAVVLKTIDALITKGWKISEENIREGLRTVTWAGRFELLRKDPVFFVDGGHNPQCMEALVKNLTDYLPDRPITALTGVMADKDFTDMYRMVAPYISRWVTVTPDNPRALPADKLAKKLSVFSKPVTACATVAEGVQTAIAQTDENGAVVAFGSLYMVGDIRTAAKE